ncbi:uncharacterized protein LOC118184865 isoform X3 [Stegodyphus dumicola]|uniref:uncharacterized protein LOC118184865 isoform X3 n=1 Tax=Stegodyphus dumicola TaxID=202533 RepID=UPI0015B023A6|nr:uncharacterized protein LOC118184865 isoform X3 [Stegodyphus dumicola]
MERRFLSTRVSALLNSPVLPKFAQVQEDCLENVYKTKQLGPLGRAPSPKIPAKVVKSFFGRSSEKGDSAEQCMSPSNEIYFQSEYSKAFNPFCKCHNAEVAPAGIKLKTPDNNGDHMKEIFTMKTRGESAIIIPISKTWKLNPDAECNFRYKQQQSAGHDSIHHGSKYGNCDLKCDMEEKKIIHLLCSLLKGNTASDSEDHLCGLKGCFQISRICVIAVR